MRVPTVLAAAAAVLLSAVPTFAQDAGQTGLTIAFPAAIGVIWHATDRMAIRPDFAFSQSGADLVNGSNTSASLGVSALFYLGKWDNLRTYVSPRFGYQRTSLSAGDAETTSLSGSGSFGVQYQLHRRFAVFGEAGIAYTHSTSSTTNSNIFVSNPSAYSWGTRAGIGTIFYF